MKLNNTHLNILASYAYLGKSKTFSDALINQSQLGTMNVMLDSGAFTLFNAKQKREWLTLDNYCKYINQYGHLIEKYVMLDVIGNDDASKVNYEKMIKRDLNPMFVYTMADDDYNYLKDATKKNKHICVAGGVTTKGDWIKKRFQDVYKHTNGLIHGLGYVSYPSMYQLPIHSVDSSSWIQSSQVYGILSYFDNGMKGVAYKDVLKRVKKLPIQLIKLLEELKINPKQFSNLDNHKGARSIAALINLISYLEYQKYSKRLGIKLFLAINNVRSINDIIFVNEEYNQGTLNFSKWQKLK